MFQTLQIINITVCDTAKHRAVYHGVLNGYLYLPFMLLFILVVLTAKVPLSAFQREHLATYRAIMVAVVPATLITIAHSYILILEPSLFRTYIFLGLEACWTLLLIILLLVVLVPAVSLSLAISSYPLTFFFTRSTPV